MGKLENVKLSDIAQNPVALRNVDRQSEDFINLKNSIQKQGVLNAINIRPAKEGSDKKYELIDGLHRYMASLEAGVKEIPAQIISMDDAQVLQAQLIANVHTIKTKPVEFAKQIQRILSTNPTFTISQLATELSVSPTFISERLGLLKLDKKIAALVDEDKITLSNAYALAKLPPEEQANYLQQAQATKPNEFVPQVNARLKEIREAKRSGKSPKKAGFEPTPKMRKRSDLVGLVEDDNKDFVKKLVAEYKPKTPTDGALLMLKWVLQLDQASVEAQKAKYEQRQQELEAAKARRKAEADKKRAAESAKVAAEVSETVEK